MVVPFGCIHSIAEQSITAQIPNWLKEKLLKKKNYALLLTGFCLAEASKKIFIYQKSSKKAGLMQFLTASVADEGGKHIFKLA